MIYFRSDYSLGAHPKVMEALMRTNMEHSDGYALDEHCDHAREMVKELIGVDDCQVHMMVGGTPCNITTVSAALRAYDREPDTYTCTRREPWRPADTGS